MTGAGGDVGRQPRWECTVLAELARRGRARARARPPWWLAVAGTLNAGLDIHVGTRQIFSLSLSLVFNMSQYIVY